MNDVAALSRLSSPTTPHILRGSRKRRPAHRPQPTRNRVAYIKEKIYQFSTYVEMKNLNDSFDLDNFEQYEEYSRKIEKFEIFVILSFD